MRYTITAYDMVDDEVLSISDDLSTAHDSYDSVIKTFKDGTHGFDLEDLEDGVTITLEDWDTETIIIEQTFHWLLLTFKPLH